MADAAVLKIVISPYLSRESSEYDEIWYADANFDPGDGNVKKLRNSQIQDGGRTPYSKIIFLAITRLHIVRLNRNLEFGGLIARVQRFRDEKVKFRKSNMANG